jgi:hypothetical protein
MELYEEIYIAFLRKDPANCNNVLQTDTRKGKSK